MLHWMMKQHDEQHPEEAVGQSFNANAVQQIWPVGMDTSKAYNMWIE